MYDVYNKSLLYGFKCNIKKCYLGGYTSIDVQPGVHKIKCLEISKMDKYKRLKKRNLLLKKLTKLDMYNV